MADRRHAHADQVVGGQLGQHLGVDIVVTECRRILFKAQPAQPRRYIHAVILDSAESQPLVNEDTPLPVDLPAAELE